MTTCVYRVEDITDPEDVRQNRNIDRNISMYGYVRGTYLRPGEHDYKHARGQRE